jgi:hypothetical protein
MTDELYPNSAYKPDRDIVTSYDSIEAYNEYLGSIPVNCNSANRSNNKSFYGETFDRSRILLEQGDLSCAAKAETILEQFADTNIFTHNASIIGSDVVGFTPIIPAALMGHPNAMLVRQQVEREAANTPINIYFEVAVSAGVDTDQIFNRGSAALALCMALGMKRPTTLYAVEGFRNNPSSSSKKTILQKVKVCENVIDLSRAAFVMTSREYARRLAFTAVVHLSNYPLTSLPWPFGITPQDDNYEISMRHACGAMPDDIYIKGGYLLDQLALHDPVAWVKKMIEKHSPDNVEE